MSIGCHLGRSNMVVAWRCQQLITKGIDYHQLEAGRPRNTNMHDDRAIITEATSSPTTSLEFDQRHLPTSIYPVVSRETIRRTLAAGIRSQQPLRHRPLTSHHRQYRLDLC
ncbi:hypothetical protein TNCV_2360911 [Trichonephila clavipes]|nr:hypothetical protein TNCV_2360911 [Trichonephila clavipes]